MFMSMHVHEVYNLPSLRLNSHNAAFHYIQLVRLNLLTDIFYLISDGDKIPRSMN